MDEPGGRLRDADRIVGENLRKLRAEIGYTQRELAAKLQETGWSIGHTAIAKMEGGTRSLRAREIFVLAEMMGVFPTDLVEDPEEEGLRQRLIETYEAAKVRLRESLSELLDARTQAIEGAELVGIELDLEPDDFAKEVLGLLAMTELRSRREPTSSQVPRTSLVEVFEFPAKRVEELAPLYEAVKSDVGDEGGRDGVDTEAP